MGDGVMIKAILLSAPFFFIIIDCMDRPLLGLDLFSDQPNNIRRAFIFPLLKNNTNTFRQVRNILLSIALVSKKSYAQVMCPFFVRDIIKMFGEGSPRCDIELMQLLNIPCIQNYMEMNKKIMEFTDTRKFQRPSSHCFTYLLDRGADINCTFSDYNVTPLMRAVYINRLDLVQIFTRRGANVGAYIHNKKDNRWRKLYYVRDCNMIYNLQKLNNCLQAHETQKLRTALKIDKFLEIKNAPSLVTINNNFLVCSLRQEIKAPCKHGYGVMLSNVYNNDKDKIKKEVPHAIAQALCAFIEFKNSEKGR
jgi:hypothetical protein